MKPQFPYPIRATVKDNSVQAIMETAFDAVYLVTVITLGVLMIKKSNGKKEYLLFGIMAVTLGAGDSFHLVPRAYALCTLGLEQFTRELGIGKFITSLTMTVFYILLYYVWRLRYKIKGQNGLTAAIYILSAVRILFFFSPRTDGHSRMHLYPGESTGTCLLQQWGFSLLYCFTAV